MRVIQLAASVIAITLLPTPVFAQQAANDWFNQPASYANVSEQVPDEEVHASTVDDCCGGGQSWEECCEPLWTVSAGAVILTRGAPQSSPIARNFQNTSTLLDANEFKFNWAAGADISAVRRVVNVDAVDAIDVRYFGVQSWQASSSMDTNGFWRFPNGVGLFHPSHLDSVWRSQFYSAELNVRRNSSYSWLTSVAGFRWLQLNDQLNIMQRLADSSRHDFDTTTRNNLYGVQVGAITRILDGGGPLAISCASKAGIYGNAAANHWNVNSTLLSADQQDQFAFVGDVNALANYRISDHIAFQGGYQLLWIEGVAVAGDQFAAMHQQTTHDGINSTGGAFFHGATAGLTLTW